MGTVKRNNFLRRVVSNTLLITLCLIVVFSFSGCYLFPKEEKVLAPPLIDSTEITYDTIEAKKGTIEKKITGSGTFASAEQQNVSFKFRSGYLKKMYVEEGDMVKKGDTLAELDTDQLQFQVKQEELILKKAQINYNDVKEKNGSSSELQKANIDVQLEQLKLDDLKQQLQKSKLTSPISGEVVFIDKVNPGDYVNVNKTLISVADTSKLLVQYSNENASEFKIGANVGIKYDNKDYQGVVVMNPGSVPVDANENLKKSAMIKVEGVKAAIGDTVQVSITLEKRDNVIVLPRNVVSKNAGRTYVQVLDKDMKYERDVETGLETATDVEIVKGLNEGDKVIVR